MFLSFCFYWGVAKKGTPVTIEAFMCFCCFLVGCCYIVEARYYGASGTSPHLLVGPDPHDHFRYNLRMNALLKYGYRMIRMKVR